MKIALIGSGSFGSTMSIIIASNLLDRKDNTPIFMYIRREELLEALNKKRIHPDYPALKNVLFPKNINFSLSLEEVLADATHLVFSTPSKYAKSMLLSIKGKISKETKIISLVKGFFIDEDNNFMRISTLIKEILEIDNANICTLSGPNVYTELASNYDIKNPIHRACNTVISSTSSTTAQEFQELYFAKDILRTYYSNDIIASEICGALKNIIALVGGIGDGSHNNLGYGINYKASLMTRAIYEFGYFVRAFGGNPMNVNGLAGIGDLIATCQSGRSTKAGLLFAKGYSVDKIKQELYPNEIEAFQTLTVVNQYIQNLRRNNPNVCLSVPLIEGSYEVVFNNISYDDMMNKIINRPRKKELRDDPYLVF